MVSPNLPSLGAAVLAAAAAGFVNALAGGGTLITFPVLIFLGLPAVEANVTSSLALLPGYLSSALAQGKALAGQKRRLALLLPLAILGGLGGAVALLATGDKLFQSLVPWLLYLGVALLAAQGPIKRALGARSSSGRSPLWALAILLATVYGGYFGAGVSIVILSALSLAYDEDLGRLNALKQVLSLGAGLGSCAWFAVSGRVHWDYAGIMALGALAGGFLGGRLAGRLRPGVLKAIVLVLGTLVATYYLVR